MNDRIVVAKEFSRALARLREGASEDPAKCDLVIDGVIQRFEFSFELGWKLLKSILHHEGIECASPRGCIKEAVRIGILRDGDGWIGMLEARNRTSHLYDGDDAKAIYESIRGTFVGLLVDLETQARNFSSNL
jgi:nucleotidyltransferase substrate binding protein (TIGR01987 family)